MSPRISPDELQRCRDNFAAWMEWHMLHFAEVTPSKTALAEHLGISPPAITKLLRKGSKTFPSLKTLLRAKALLGTGFPVDAILFSKPPDAPK